MCSLAACQLIACSLAALHVNCVLICGVLITDSSAFCLLQLQKPLSPGQVVHLLKRFNLGGGKPVDLINSSWLWNQIIYKQMLNGQMEQFRWRWGETDEERWRLWGWRVSTFSDLIFKLFMTLWPYTNIFYCPTEIFLKKHLKMLNLML